MPESVTDRCTKAHEYIFLMAKSERYHYDAKAIAEEAKYAGAVVVNNNGKNAGLIGKLGGRARAGFLKDGGVLVGETRNRRSVWTISTKPYHGAHFATFPEDLVEPCILAGCPIGGTVLDPFAGSGTTLAVAHRLNRRAIGCELNPEYVELAKRRVGEAHDDHVATPLFDVG
jgi:DNA modification methylase